MYVSNEDQGPMSEAREGATVRVEGRGPPRIVVDHDLAAVLVVRWPGRLWRVRIIDRATAGDQGWVTPNASARYTRAVAVDVLSEEDVGNLFGENGRSVASVIDLARQLTATNVDLLSRRRSPQASMIVDQVWRRWMVATGIPMNAWDKNMDGILYVEGGGSPIGRGLAVISEVVARRAADVESDTAFVIAQDDPEGRFLAPLWQTAASALGDAALALGAASMMSEEERRVLLEAWQALAAMSA